MAVRLELAAKDYNETSSTQKTDKGNEEQD